MGVGAFACRDTHNAFWDIIHVLNQNQIEDRVVVGQIICRTFNLDFGGKCERVCECVCDTLTDMSRILCNSGLVCDAFSEDGRTLHCL